MCEVNRIKLFKYFDNSNDFKRKTTDRYEEVEFVAATEEGKVSSGLQVAELGVGIAFVQVFFDLKIRGKNLFSCILFNIIRNDFSNVDDSIKSRTYLAMIFNEHFQSISFPLNKLVFLLVGREPSRPRR